ncbi:hypothetical protein DXG01_002040 [Tephrocybe rancida]|nr:hypothetical protein DXG01_002040 [Tephrocybe rancida]
MHHTLEISDILGPVFSFTDPKTNIACTQVCKAWLENALDALWCRLDRLERLLRILGPMGQVGPQFPRLLTLLRFHIDNDKWDRFLFYSKRIRHLEVTDRASEIHQQAFSTLSIARPFLHLLPNLTHLTWKKGPSQPAESLVLCILFLTPALKSLSVETGNQDASDGDLAAINNFFKDVVYRSPQMEFFELQSETSFRKLGPSLSNLFLELPALEAVTLSEHLLTSDIITALAKCPHLQAIRTSNAPVGQEESDDLENFMPVVEPGAFPCIREMSIKAHLWNVLSFLQSDFPAPRLRRLVVQTVIHEDNDNVGSFFKLIADTCPDIEMLALSMPYDTDTAIAGLPFSDLEPLLQCGSLTSFRLSTREPLDMDDTDAAKVAVAWPRLQELSLSPSPTGMKQEGNHITLEVMASFAQHCPLLEVLELYIESSPIPPTEARKLFPNLKTLVLGLVGASYTSETLAGFLTDITPPNCTIKGAAYIFVDHEAHARAHASAAHSKLTKTLALLPMLRSVHAQYRQRLRAMEAEVERLLALVATAGLA